MKKTIETLLCILLFICSSQINAQSSESTLVSVEEYLKNLINIESEGGKLFCDNKEGGVRHKFNSCKDFLILRKQGCFGYTTYEMNIELRYTSTCEEIKAIKQTSIVNIDYFELNSSDWWQSLPAEIIPMPGGVYTDESWAREKLELDRLVSGKLLRELKFRSITVKKGEVELVLSVSEDDCGEIRDLLKFSAVLLADFDNDGKAELLIKGHRSDQSESCHLGSGNSLGAGFTALLKKTNAAKKSVILPYPAK